MANPQKGVDSSKPKKKEYNTERVYSFFNTFTVDTPELLINALDDALSASLKGHFYEHWITLDNKIDQLKKSWHDEKFKRWWIDNLVEEYSYIVWNTVQKHQMKVLTPTVLDEEYNRRKKKWEDENPGQAPSSKVERNWTPNREEMIFSAADKAQQEFVKGFL